MTEMFKPIADRLGKSDVRFTPDNSNLFVKYSDETKKQTKWSLAAVLISIFSCLIAICLSRCSVTLNENQTLFKTTIKVIIDNSL